MPSPLSLVPRIDAVRIHQEGTRVMVIRDGKAILDMPWQAADQVAAALTAGARRAEQCEPKVAQRIAEDQGLLLRAGIPLGLTDVPAIQEMAKVEAVSNRDLRRAMPGGVKSMEVVGTPALIVSDPPPRSDDHG